MSDTQQFSIKSFYSEAPMELEHLPNLEERRETLRRANDALERARVLLENVRRLEPGRSRKIRSSEDGASTGSAPDGQAE